MWQNIVGFTCTNESNKYCPKIDRWHYMFNIVYSQERLPGNTNLPLCHSCSPPYRWCCKGCGPSTSSRPQADEAREAMEHPSIEHQITISNPETEVVLFFWFHSLFPKFKLNQAQGSFTLTIYPLRFRNIYIGSTNQLIKKPITLKKNYV